MTGSPTRGDERASSPSAEPALGFPRIAGKWDMAIDWQREHGSGSLTADASISERPDGLDMVVHAPGSDSHTLHVRWVREASGASVLYYVFAVEPRASGSEVRAAYKGAAVLRPNEDGSRLSGNYWTDQFSRGHYELTREIARVAAATDGGQVGMAVRRRPSMRRMFLALPVVMLAAILLFLFLPSSRTVSGEWEKRIDFSVAQASKACLLETKSSERREIETGLASRLRNLGGRGATTVEMTRRSVNEAFSEAGQIAQDRSLRECVAERTDHFLNYEPGRSQLSTGRPATLAGAGTARPSGAGTAETGAAVGYVYYEEDDGRLTQDGVFGPIDGSPAPAYGDLRTGTVLRSVRGAELRVGAEGGSPNIRKLAAGQCVRILDAPTAPLGKLVAATSGGRVRVQAVSCPS